jgi:hypothetical protein
MSNILKVKQWKADKTAQFIVLERDGKIIIKVRRMKDGAIFKKRQYLTLLQSGKLLGNICILSFVNDNITVFLALNVPSKNELHLLGWCAINEMEEKIKPGSKFYEDAQKTLVKLANENP